MVEYIERIKEKEKKKKKGSVLEKKISEEERKGREMSSRGV